MATRMKIALVSSALSLFMFVTLFWMQFGSTEMENPKKPAKISKRDDKKSPSTKIRCEENETLIYDYESQTSLWEKSGGILHLSALVSVNCMGKEPVDVTTDSYKLGYLIQIGDMKIELKNKSYHGINVYNGDIEKSEAFENLLKSIFIPSGKIRINEDSKRTDNFTKQDRKYNIPFLFFQYENGNFADIFFLNEDNSSFIRNFKRQLAYTLVTSLNENVTNVAEETPYGNQKIHYNSESADGIAREMFGWKFQKPLSSNKILVKHWIDSKDNIEYDQENTYEFNNQHQFDFWYIQLQLFRNGKMIEAKGRCSHEFSNSLGKLQMQFIDINKDELIRDFKVQSTFVFKLRSYKKHSIPENISINYLKSEFQFLSSSLLPEYETETGAELFLNTFYFQYKKEIEKKMKKLFETNFSDSYELSKLLEMINLEISLGINYEVNSITNIVKRKLNEHYVSRICLESPNTCPKLFYLYCLVGGKSAENMLISYLTGNKSTGVMRYHAINSLSELLNPSEEFIENILLLIESLEDQDIVGTLIVNLGIITRKSSIPIDIQTKVAETFLNFIETSSEKCIVTPFITDIFIGLGNLQDKITLHKLLLHIETCMKNENYQIVALNALRQLYSQSEVQKWLLKLLSVGSCKLKSNIVSILAEECVPRNKNGAAPNWPQVDFNEIDELLHYWLVSNMFHYNNCPSIQQLYQYFEKKMHPETKNLFKKFYFYYVNKLRRKRDLYSGYMDHETCSNKLNSFRNYALTLNSDAFINYKYQKHCNGEQIFGKSKLNAVYKTGISTMLEDENNYIVTNRLGKTINVLGRSFDMGSITIYNFNRTMRIYHNFDGETRADIISEFICQIGTLNYPAFYHIPLYTFPIGIILMSFGIHISGDLNLTVSCPEDGIFSVQPVSKIRVALEGLGTFPPIQAAINLGATFNTHMDTYLQPIPHWCTNSSVGYEPMIISTEAWFLIPPNPRQHFSPDFLKWEIGESNDIPLTEFCLDPNVPQTTSPREDNTTFTEITTKSGLATLSSTLTLTSASVKTNETNLHSENSVKYNFK